MKVFVVKDLDTGLYYQGGCRPRFGDETKAKRYSKRSHALAAVVQWYGKDTTKEIEEKVADYKKRYPQYSDRWDQPKLDYRIKFPRLALITAEIKIEECESMDILSHIENRGGK